jgi:hypothetical protein
MIRCLFVNINFVAAWTLSDTKSNSGGKEEEDGGGVVFL